MLHSAHEQDFERQRRKSASLASLGGDVDDDDEDEDIIAVGDLDEEAVVPADDGQEDAHARERGSREFESGSEDHTAADEASEVKKGTVKDI